MRTEDGSESGNTMLMIRHKVVFAGDVCVGKTAIMNRFIEDVFNDNYDPTIGVDFFSKQIEFRDSSIKIQIWDSAGQERYRSLIPSYVKGASIIFIVYDVNKKETFDSVPSWIDFIRHSKMANAVMVLCGNKTDLTPAVTSEQGKSLAEKEGMLFFETSAKTGKNIRYMFFSSVAELQLFKQYEIEDRAMIIDELENQNKKGKVDTMFDIPNSNRRQTSTPNSNRTILSEGSVKNKKKCLCC